MRTIILLFSLVSLGCSAVKRGGDSYVGSFQKQDPRAIALFQKASEHLEDREFAPAVKILDDLLVDHPSTQLDLVFLYNSGVGYEGLNNCEMAQKRFREVIRVGGDRYNKLEAQALYRLSFVHLCLGNFNKHLVTLLDLYKRKKYLPFEVKVAEMPARLATAYSIIGNKDMAKKVYKKAESGLVAIQSQNKPPVMKRRSLAKTLFYMGDLKRIKPNTMGSDRYLDSIEDVQKYLLKSVEMNSKPWSYKA